VRPRGDNKQLKGRGGINFSYPSLCLPVAVSHSNTQVISRPPWLSPSSCQVGAVDA